MSDPQAGVGIPRLIEGLSRPEAYPYRVDRVEVRQTHISVVFLAGEFAYKIKKPVNLGFLDFSTLARRERDCREEVRLNRRLAPDVYLGVVPIVEGPEGLVVGSAVEPGSEAVAGPDAEPGADPVRGPRETGRELSDGRPEGLVEWAVRMRRLPDDLTLAAWLADRILRPYHVAVVGRRIAGFHGRADRSDEIARWGRFEVVARNARENLEQAVGHLGVTLAPELHARLAAALDRELERLEPLIRRRAAAGVPCDTHGDLHLDHIYVFPDREPPGDIVIIDCIEFNERFRYADPVADIAFLDMDLRFHGATDLAVVLDDAYFEASGDAEGRALLGFYAAYRAAVRAKVEGMKALEHEVDPADRRQSRDSSRAHWILALGLLEPPERRPGLVLVGGLPGTGKSTLAGRLAERAGFSVVSSDITRKRLAGLPADVSAAAAFGAGIYAPEWNERTYRALLEEAEDRISRGERVIVDASFREDARRAAFLDLARRLRVPAIFLDLRAPPNRVRDRILARQGGPSDADVDIYEEAAARWEEVSGATEALTRRIDTGQSRAWSVEQAVAHLGEIGLLSR